MVTEVVSMLPASYVKSQLALLPMYALLFFCHRSRLDLRLTWLVYRVVMFGSVAVPACLLLLQFWPVQAPVLVIDPMRMIQQATDAAAKSPAAAGVFRASLLFSILGLAYVVYVLIAGFRFQERLTVGAARIRNIKGTKIIFSDRISSPFVTKLLHCRIFVPARLLRERGNLATIIHHEIQHVRRNDHLYTAFEFLHYSIGWYNPLTHWSAAIGRECREMLCDQAVLKDTDSIAYGKLLISEADNALGSRWALSARFVPSKFTLQRRVKMILDDAFTKTSRALRALAPAALVITAALVLALGVKAKAVAEATAKAQVELTQAEIVAVVNANLPGLTAVYNLNLKETPTLKGVYQMKWSVNPAGTVTKCRVDSSGHQSPAFEKDLVKAISTWKFPSHEGKGEAVVIYPFAFSR